MASSPVVEKSSIWIAAPSLLPFSPGMINTVNLQGPNVMLKVFVPFPPQASSLPSLLSLHRGHPWQETPPPPHIGNPFTFCLPRQAYDSQNSSQALVCYLLPVASVPQRLLSFPERRVTTIATISSKLI